jgi:N-methylhydantoinase A
MIGEGRSMLAKERVGEGEMSFQRFLDLRYEGQEFAIKVPVSDDEIARGELDIIRKRFDSIHERSYGHAAPDEPLEMVNVRVAARGMRQKMQMPTVSSSGDPKPRTYRQVCFDRADRFVETPVYTRDTLPAGFEVIGPALIEEYGSTTVLFAGDRAKITPTGEIVVTVGAAP